MTEVIYRYEKNRGSIRVHIHVHVVIESSSKGVGQQ